MQLSAVHCRSWTGVEGDDAACTFGPDHQHFLSLEQNRRINPVELVCKTHAAKGSITFDAPPAADWLAVLRAGPNAPGDSQQAVIQRVRRTSREEVILTEVRVYDVLDIRGRDERREAAAGTIAITIRVR
jgi:hypothetical protein